jgi:hypothetical protein
MYLLHQSFCFRLGIIQGGSYVFIAPIILFQTWDYTRRILCIYCTNHFVSTTIRIRHFIGGLVATVLDP